MARIAHFLFTVFAVVGLATVDGSALAQSKDNDRMEQNDSKGKKDGKEQKTKKHKHHNGKDVVGDKIKKNGKHEIQKNGKHTSFVDVKGGKIAGMTVVHAEKGNVLVKKYKTSKKMAEQSGSGMQKASFVLAQAQFLGTTWIGYSYFDDWGYEVIYWFPYDMIYDGDTGAIEYIPVYY